MILANEMMRFTSFTSILRCLCTRVAVVGLVDCGEERTASVAGMMRFTSFTGILRCLCTRVAVVDLVGCGEERSALLAGMMRFTSFTSILRCLCARVAMVDLVGCGEERTASVTELRQRFFLQIETAMVKIQQIACLYTQALLCTTSLNNTLQASLVACYHDAQTGGLIIFRGFRAV